MYNKKSKYIILMFISVLFLSGCTGSKNIQDLTYIVSIGLDYDKSKDEYTAYLQGLNFANVAKQEGARPIEPIPTFVGSASGKTLNMAVSNLYKLTRPPLFFGHTKALVLSRDLLENKFKEVLEDVGRNRSLRPSLELFTTDMNMEEVFSAKGLFDYPPVYTVLLTEEKVESLQDEIETMSLMHFLREYYEPMGTAFIPNIRIDQDSWKSGDKLPLLYLDGYNVFQDAQLMGHISSEDSILVDWLMKDHSTLNYSLYKEEELLSTFKLSSKKPKVKYSKEDSGFPKFSLEVNVEAELLEKINDVPYEELQSTLEDSIEKRVETVYNRGLENQMDLYDVGVKWFRSHPKEFKKLKEDKSFYLTDNSLDKVKVNVNIKHFNAYRYEKRQ
ncbi:Ger(x)C family spore germination protein [Rossellomorea sp. AcN35-11]|nr:Ger(x)C family spore germination protein [Rossellomorea aquimaris]WJV28792.1 Ger(x)C family spore germination protein [Rossellomorea sp. AcN35-11]